MTVHDDLATLRECVNGNAYGMPRHREALARVEAEIARLEQRVKFCPSCAGAFVPETEPYEGPCAGCRRAEAAEAALSEQQATFKKQLRAGTEDLRAEIARLQDELERHKEMESVAGAREFGITQERDRLRDGLRRIEQTCDGAVKRIEEVGQPPEHWSGTQIDPERMRDFARALLADQDGAATCEKCRHPSHEPGACEVNVGTGYHGPVPCRCGVLDPAPPPEDGAA